VVWGPDFLFWEGLGEGTRTFTIVGRGTAEDNTVPGHRVATPFWVICGVSF
jgi:hypothetical protein